LPAGRPIPCRGAHLAAATKVEDPARPTLPEIYQRELDYVWRTLRRLGIPAADLEDAAHEVFVVVHRRLGDYDPARPLRPWLFGIAYRTTSQRRRRSVPGGAPVRDDDVLELPDQAPSAESLLATEQARLRVHRALDTLPLEQRAVMIMHDLDGLSAPELAAALEIPLNTVYSRLRLARAKFTAAIQQPEGVEE
jgi:RNA polymerase sigma-70 factor (ECF subfamily)